jgi:L-lactate dehydrogenase complex protein LldG
MPPVWLTRLLERRPDERSSVPHPGRFPWAEATDSDGLLERFTRELTTLGGHVHHANGPGAIAEIVFRIASANGGEATVLAWGPDQLPVPGVLDALRATGLTVLDGHVPGNKVERKARMRDLERASVGLTGVVGAIADSGTIVVASGPGRGRLASLLPPVHLALVPRPALHPSLASFLSVSSPVVTASGNVAFITGPSRTSDIELISTRGVHGPKDVHIVIV